jgi:hypothetical protein
MAIEKSLSQAPLGMSPEMMEEMMGAPDIEIEIEDPEEVTIRAGDLEIEIEPAERNG